MSRRKVQLLVSVSLVGAMLSGCWGQVGFDPGHTRHNPVEDTLTRANVETLEQEWSVELREQASEPMVRSGRVFLTTWIPDSTIDVRSLSTATGATEWNQQLANWSATAAFWATPATFVGNELWSGFAAVGQVGGHPSGDIKAPVRIDPATGSIVAKESLHLVASAAIDADGYVVQNSFGFDHQKLTVRDGATLDPLWSATIPRQLLTPPPTPYPTAIAGGRIFVVDHTGKLHAFALAGCGADTCTSLWSLDLGIAAASSQPVALGGQVFVAAGEPGNPDVGNATLAVIDPATGSVIRTGALAGPGTFVNRDLAATSDTVYGVAGATLSAFSAVDACFGGTTACLLWTAALPSPATASPVVAGNVVYVATEGALHAFAAEGCRVSPCSPVASIAMAGTPDHVVVAAGKAFVVHRPTPDAPAKLTAFAPTAP